MNIEILYKPAHSVARVQLAVGESVTAESGAMVSTSGNVTMTTSAGGLGSGLKRLLGAESFFRNTFTAEGASGEVLLAPVLCGDLAVADVDESNWYIASSAYVGGDDSVDLQTKVGGFKGFFSGAGLFILRASGRGKVIFGAFGALECIDVEGELLVDTGHLIAWEDSPELTHTVTKVASGWISSFLSGEGLVCRFKGSGKVWVQTRNPGDYGASIGRLLPPREN